MTQGTIFSGALAEDYVGCAVCGIVITARCDVSHDKVSRYTYLPLVKTCNWLERDGVELSLERATKDLWNTFASHLKTCGLTERLLDTESPHRILTVLFPQCAEASAIRKMRPKLSDIAARLEKLQQLTACNCYRKRLHAVREINPRIVDGVPKI
jgi:hypothetical protein